MEDTSNETPLEIPPPKNTKSETDSVSLSLSLPMGEDRNSKSEEISEHILSPNSDSLENDRSFQEIVVPTPYQDIYVNEIFKEDISKDKQSSVLDTSLQSETSVISLHFLEKIEDEYVRNVLEDILQTKSELDATASSKDESFNMFQNLNLNDKSLTNRLSLNNSSFDDKSFNNVRYSLDEKNLDVTNFGLDLVSNDVELNKELKDMEEIVMIKDNTLEIDSMKETSNTNTMSTLSTTEYKQLQEEWQGKLLEFNSEVAYKNDLIEQLTKSLSQSLKERTALLTQIDDSKNEITDLHEKLAKACLVIENLEKSVVKEKGKHEISEIEGTLPDSVNKYFEQEYLVLQANLDSIQQKNLEHLNFKFNEILEETVSKTMKIHEQEIKQFKDEVAKEKEELECEISRLRLLLAEFQNGTSHMMDLKNELELKHSQEMEELRMYFERKCADMEKNYSEEIFSQQSKKMSSSSCSDDELNSDLPLSHAPGPEGDVHHDFQSNISKKDVINLQNELSSIINKINKCDLDAMTDDDFANLRAEIGRSNLPCLLKCYRFRRESDTNADNVNKLDDIDAQCEGKITENYDEGVENLRQLEYTEKNNISVSSAVQEVGSSGEFEIKDVIQSYERRLQEQVTLAKIDIISALETQIQRLAASEIDDEEWPTELLKLRNRFKEKYEIEIEDLKRRHQLEIEKLRQENLKVILESTRRRSSKEGESIDKGVFELLSKERDNLKRQVSSLRNLLGELLKYFTQCEDELNNTLVDELLKQGFDKNLSQIEDELNFTQSSPTSSSKTSDSTLNVTRVHLTPNFTDLINIIENSSTEEGDSKDISIGLKNELSVCLEKLKHEANAILALTSHISKQPANENIEDRGVDLDEQIAALTRKLISETQLKEEFKSELEENQKYVETLEKERERLEAEIETVVAKENMLEVDLINAKNKIAQLLENGRKEIVSEGYGEAGFPMRSLGDTVSMLAELQEKARNVLAQTRTGADPNLLHLIEELCQVVEKIKEESKRDRCDLIQQINAADKKYRTTQKFLEEQAAERELERDEAQKKIDALYNQLRERDKEKINSVMVASEVNGAYCRCRDNSRAFVQIELLEQQLQEKSSELEASSMRIKDVETERNEAVEKIKVLRDIIRDLELQTESKSAEIEDYLRDINKLQNIIAQQEALEGSEQRGDLKDASGIEELYRHIEKLENELQILRLQTELGGNEGTAKQIRTQLYEIEIQVDKKTKELETLHSTASTNCSSPSEDLSAREIVLPKSPKKMEDCEVPLQQLARLREKLIRHSRAEDAAMKRIRDLEMQVFGLKQELEETASEREYLKKQIQEQLVLISDFQIRLDEQRIRADNIEKQTNTSLELKIYDMQNEITSLREKLQQKEKYINNQVVLLKETQDRVRNLENEVSCTKDDDLIVEMQKEIDKLRSDNAQMKKKIQNDSQMVPNLVENIISDKNNDMERLRLKLDDTEKLLEAYTSLNLDKKDLKTLAEIKNNGTNLEELISIIDLSHGDQVRRMESKNNSESLMTTNLFLKRRKSDETLMDAEISSIIGPNTATSVQARNSTEISHRRVHFEDTEIENFKKEIKDLKTSLESKDTAIKEYEDKLKLLNNLETKIEKLQTSLEETEKTLAAASETFEKEQKELKDREKELGIQLAQKKLELEEKEKELNVLEQDSKRKDEMCKNLTREKNILEKELTKLKHENFLNVDEAIKIKNSEINDLKQQLSSKYKCETEKLMKELCEKSEETERLLNEIDQITMDLGESQSTNNILKNNLEDYSNEIRKLNKELENKNLQIESLTTELNTAKEKLNKRKKIIRDLEDTVSSQKSSLQSLYEDQEQQKSSLMDKESTIDVLKEDAERYQRDIAILESDIEVLKNGDCSKLKQDLQQKEDKINELIKEKTHLLELLNEKEKIINQMAEDSHQLHLNLVTIKSKIKEPGNIVDMGNKLREEQRKTAELVQEIHNLKIQLLQCKNNDMTSSVDEIADQLKRELDNSIKIDSNIMTAVSDQSLNSISEIHDVEACRKSLSKEKTNKKQLLQHVHKLQAKITELQNELEKERAALLQTRTEDALCIQKLRIQLDVVLDNVETLKKIVAEKENENSELEKELDSLKRKNISSASKSESTEYKKLPTVEAVALNKLQMEYETLQGEKNKLTNDLATMKQTVIELENTCSGTKDLLTLEVQRKKNLEDKVQFLQKREKEFKESLMKKSLEMERVVDELSQEKADLIKQKLELLQRLKSQNPFDYRPPPLSGTIPDELLNKIKELNAALLDNRKLMDLITRISNEKKQIENELEILKCTNKNNNSQLPTNDLIARADYLFAKTLKLESTKKALIFQKRYLMQCILTHNNPIETLPDPATQRNKFRLNSNRTHRFRAAVFVVVSVIRMKYLVRRWHSGVRIAEKINARHYKPRKRTEINTQPAQFQVGQPVSNQFFLNVPTNTNTTRNLNPFVIQEEAKDESNRLEEVRELNRNEELLERSVPWSGTTPPSKEKRSKIFIGSNSLNKQDMDPLKAPQLLAQFVERFDQIQEKLDVVLDTNSS
ncbi:cytadherence high molecular weight protein 2-like isoform X1 [Diorhabda carinulata]|uniref:cytadherence high molecular weight protein 2-like isoform X1 n=1 Tax=Diorhabda carinulata TaxID=1163345 RepID=UPI0025A28727|nr:cytadherence high molecular weight protein 2-like isoform X1 [Diorhabda carinulata]